MLGKQLIICFLWYSTVWFSSAIVAMQHIGLATAMCSAGHAMMIRSCQSIRRTTYVLEACTITT